VLLLIIAMLVIQSVWHCQLVLSVLALCPVCSHWTGGQFVCACTCTCEWSLFVLHVLYMYIIYLELWKLRIYC